jgi:NADH:ubiquinone oxidoreductase subunit 4 (subunit M)
MSGYFPAPKLMGAISATAVILAAMYLLTMYQKVDVRSARQGGEPQRA